MALLRDALVRGVSGDLKGAIMADQNWAAMATEEKGNSLWPCHLRFWIPLLMGVPHRRHFGLLFLRH
jgi:hypothetical protein